MSTHDIADRQTPQLNSAKRPEPSLDGTWRAAAGGVSCRLGDASSAATHALTVRRSSSGQRSLVHRSLHRLQRLFGNQYVGRVLRQAGALKGDGDGMAAVERSIDQERGGGQGTRSRMESAFGADFSSVRIHTDTHADGLSQSRSARAFTTGSDIVFRQGEYSPGTLSRGEPFADQLTQTGLKSESKPLLGPSLNITRSTEVCASRAHIQRYSETASVPAMGSGSGPSTVGIGPVWGQVSTVTSSTGPSAPFYLAFPGTTETLTLAEDVSGGTVVLHLFERAEINNILLNDVQYAAWDGTVPFTVSGDQVTFGPAITTSDAHGSGATLSVTSAGGLTPRGGYVTFQVTIASSGSTTTGGSIGVGPISASAPVSGTSNFAGGLTRSFVINLLTTPPRSISGPDVSFQVGSDRLAEGQEGVIAKWFEGLSASAQDMIRNGRRAISISGYASTTGRRRKNRDLSERRARVVERILRGHAGSNANLNIFFFGEDNATTPDETEDPRWRRATIVVQAPARMAPGVPTP